MPFLTTILAKAETNTDHVLVPRSIYFLVSVNRPGTKLLSVFLLRDLSSQLCTGAGTLASRDLYTEAGADAALG